MSKSIISNEKQCLFCGTTKNLHRHHIYHGTANRKKAEKIGCWCYLCSLHHNMHPHSVHMDSEVDQQLKRDCQLILEKDHGWSRVKFIETFGKSYL